jgi:hypothetical protein
MPELKSVIASPSEGETFFVGPFQIVSRIQGARSNGTFELVQHEYFRALEKLFATTPLDTAAVHALQKKHDQELVPLDK